MSLNLTPMIDVTFQLLIFFVVTANFVREGQIFSQIPTDAPPESVPQLPIRLIIDDVGGEPVITVNNAQGSARIDHERVYIRLERDGEAIALHDYLKNMIDQGFDREKTPVSIEPSGRSEWQYTLGAYNSVVHAGFKQVTWKLK